MHKKFEVNWTKIKGSCQLGRKVVTQDFKSDLPLATLAKKAITDQTCLNENKIYKERSHVSKGKFTELLPCWSLKRKEVF